jgi:hypothetical protein
MIFLFLNKIKMVSVIKYSKFIWSSWVVHTAWVGRRPEVIASKRHVFVAHRSDHRCICVLWRWLHSQQ